MEKLSLIEKIYRKRENLANFNGANISITYYYTTRRTNAVGRLLRQPELQI